MSLILEKIAIHEREFNHLIENNDRGALFLSEFDDALAGDFQNITEIPAYDALIGIRKERSDIADYLVAQYIDMRRLLIHGVSVAGTIESYLREALQRLDNYLKLKETPSAVEVYLQRLTMHLMDEEPETKSSLYEMERKVIELADAKPQSYTVIGNENTQSQPKKYTARPSEQSVGNLVGGELGNNQWVLTFDDGPHRTRTPAILGLLSARGIKATFFVLSERAELHPNIILDTLGAPHELGCHSFSHKDLTRVSDYVLMYEVEDATKTLEAIINNKILLFRTPYGAGSSNGSRERIQIANTGLVHAFWNVDSLDWQNSTPSEIAQRVERQISRLDKGIILFHDIHQRTVDTIPIFLDNNKHLRFVNFSEAIDIST